MSALRRARCLSRIPGLLLGLAAVAASATPAEEYLLDMTIVVHPRSELASPRETVSRVDALLDHATRILEGIDAVFPNEMSCPVRFRAINVRRHDRPPATLFPCGSGVRYEAVLFPESVLGELSGCADQAGQGLGMFVGTGFYRNLDDAGATYAHEMGHLAGVPGDHVGWEGTLLAGQGLRTRTVPPNLCAIYIDHARSRGAERGIA
ncbi:MAG: hypothetical protein ACRDH5_05100, partial [bacterium]